jgi:heat shock protein HslJ
MHLDLAFDFADAQTKIEKQGTAKTMGACNHYLGKKHTKLECNTV